MKKPFPVAWREARRIIIPTKLKGTHLGMKHCESAQALHETDHPRNPGIPGGSMRDYNNTHPVHQALTEAILRHPVLYLVPVAELDSQGRRVVKLSCTSPRPGCISPVRSTARPGCGPMSPIARTWREIGPGSGQRCSKSEISSKNTDA